MVKTADAHKHFNTLVCVAATIAFVVFLLFLVLIFLFGLRWGEQQYASLATSFLHGSTRLSAVSPLWDDLIFINNNYYWPLGPLPAMMLVVPIFLQISEPFFLLSFVNLILLVSTFLVMYSLARKHFFPSLSAVWLAVGCMFGTPAISSALIPWPWYQVQLWCLLVGLLFLGEYFSKKRFLVLGVLAGMLVAARITAALVLIVPLLDILFTNQRFVRKLSWAAMLMVPVVASLVTLSFYNFARFGSFAENGYKLTSQYSLTDQQRYELLNRGLFKLINLPTNIYYYFIAAPKPVLMQLQTRNGNTYLLEPPYLKIDFPGVSIFFTAYWFFFLIRRVKNMTRDDTYLIFSGLTILALLLTYYWPGWRQVGPRYLIDLFPLVFFFLLRRLPNKHITVAEVVLIVVNISTNLLLLTSVYFWR